MADLLASLAPGSRLLVVAVERCTAEQLRAWAAAVVPGVLIGVGTPAGVRAARAALKELEHVLFTPGSRDEIPWQEAYFTHVFDASPDSGGAAETSPELLRVLAAGGGIYSVER
jgi:hypothetical protein